MPIQYQVLTNPNLRVSHVDVYSIRQSRQSIAGLPELSITFPIPRLQIIKLILKDVFQNNYTCFPGQNIKLWSFQCQERDRSLYSLT